MNTDNYTLPCFEKDYMRDYNYIYGQNMKKRDDYYNILSVKQNKEIEENNEREYYKKYHGMIDRYNKQYNLNDKDYIKERSHRYSNIHITSELIDIHKILYPNELLIVDTFCSLDTKRIYGGNDYVVTNERIYNLIEFYYKKKKENKNSKLVIRKEKKNYLIKENEQILYEKNKLLEEKIIMIEKEREEDNIELIRQMSLLTMKQKISLPEEEINELDTKEGEKECIICNERCVKTVIVDCGHSILCVTCSRTLKDKPQCPLCRVEITKIIKIYPS